MRERRLLQNAFIAAAAALFLSALPAHAQFRSGDDGRAADANPRIGSGGFNNVKNIPESFLNKPLTPSANQIITNNVTGLSGFHGNIPYRDPNEFQGRLGSTALDNFNRRSAGPPIPYQPAPPPNQPQIFYGNNLVAPPPPGLVQNPANGAYVSPPTPPKDELSDRIVLPRYTDMLLLPGPLDPKADNQIITASPLLGVRMLRPADMTDQIFLKNNASFRKESALDRLHMDPLTIQRMRDELLQTIIKGSELNGASETPAAETTSGAQRISKGAAGGASMLPGPLTASVAKPSDAPKEVGPIASKSLSPAAMTATLNTGASIENRLPTMLPPQQQSGQYAELQKKLNKYYTERFQTDEQRNREFLKLLRAKEEADKATAKPGTTTRPSALTTPDYRAMSQRLAPPAVGPNEDPRAIARTMVKPAPMHIDSLVVGVKAEGLARILSGAETMMKDGRYVAALDQYEAAQELARTSNPLITLGKAHAELAVGYYRRAEQDIRSALLGDPVLTMAQFDLKKMIGEARLEAIAKDLKEVAQRQPNDGGIPLLLAYVAYNSGHEDQAAIYLDAAQKRSGARDPLFKLLWTHWSLPDVPSTQPVK